LGAVGELAGQHVGVSDHAHEKVVEVMGDAPREHTEALPSLLFA
jgi:hypothetical protein